MAFIFYLASFHNQTPIYKDFSVNIKFLVFSYLRTSDRKIQGNYNTKVISMSSLCNFKAQGSGWVRSTSNVSKLIIGQSRFVFSK